MKTRDSTRRIGIYKHAYHSSAMATVTIRPATLDDLLAINRVHYAALDKFHDFYGAFLVPHPRDLLPRLNARGMSNPSQVFHVAVDGDEVVGFVRYQMVDAQGEAENDVKNVEPMAPQVKPKEHVKDLWEKFSERDGEMNGCYQKTSGGRRHACEVSRMNLKD